MDYTILCRTNVLHKSGGYDAGDKEVYLFCDEEKWVVKQ